jgi:hypothetical protein
MWSSPIIGLTGPPVNLVSAILKLPSRAERFVRTWLKLLRAPQHKAKHA